MFLKMFYRFAFSDQSVESYEELKEVCQLLTLKQANAILLLESLRDKKKNADGKTILEEFNVHFLTGDHFSQQFYACR